MPAKTKHIILGVHIKNRIKKASVVQKLFSEYGCTIKTRVGLHDVSENFCSPTGLVILELFGDAKTCQAFASNLKKVEGIEVKQMIFSH